MRRLTAFLLWLYLLLTAYSILGPLFGLRFHSILTPLLTLLAFLFALFHASVRLGWRKAFLLLTLTFLISLFFESVGVATGRVYGPYHYTDRLGPRFLGLVPYLIPVAWFMMIYPSLVIAVHLVPVTQRLWRWRLVLASLGALITTAWDLVMDPLMVALGHWVWEIEGAYFGIPLQNYLGWWLTTFTILGLFVLLTKIKPAINNPPKRSFDHLAISSYLITGMGNIFGCLLGGLGGVALVGFFAMFPWGLIAWWNSINKK